MSKTIQDYFDNAQLSQASYAKLFEGMKASDIQNALHFEQGEGTYSQSQASQFAQKYSIVHSQQNTVSGFSATVFKDTAGGYTFAIRGTEPSDFSPDVLSADFGDIGGDGIALKQAVH
jgi:hypothetical protein